MEHNEINERIAEASKTILSYCLARTSTREDAEDLAQDILLNLAQSLPNLRDSGAFYGFMWGLAGNVYKQWYRKKLRDKTDVLEEELPDEEELLAEENEELYLLRRELGLLEEKFRRAAILYYIDGLGCAEIARQLSVSESMAKYLLFKARKILKEGITIMERKLGSLSYNPKTLIPMYSGAGPNRWWDFLHKSKIRQNILAACCEDFLTAEQISLEIGIPLPYLEDEIAALEEKDILRREGKHYQANVLIITAECGEEMTRTAAVYQDQIADAIHGFLNDNAEKFRSIGFRGAEFAGNTLRWQLATLVMREIMHHDSGILPPSAPVTAWGEPAWIWCREEGKDIRWLFNYSGMGSRERDVVLFFDYLPAPHGDHHDFYGNERRTNLLCDIARGKQNFSEYDLEEIAVMISLGYVKKEGESFLPTMPVYTVGQYQEARAMAADFVRETLGDILHALSASAVRILQEHSPRHLADQAVGIALMDNFFNTVAVPGQRMVDKGYLCTDWLPNELPGTFLVLDYADLDQK